MKMVKVRLPKPYKQAMGFDNIGVKEECVRYERNGRQHCNLLVGLNSNMQPLAVYQYNGADLYPVTVKGRGSKPPYYYRFSDVHYILEVRLSLKGNEIVHRAMNLLRPVQFRVDDSAIDCQVVMGAMQYVTEAVKKYAEKRCIFRCRGV